MANTTGWSIKAAYAATGFTATSFNSLASGSWVASSAYANGTNLYLYADLSFSLVVGGTTTASSYMSLYILPLNQDASTYGDNTSAGTTLPTISYLVGNVSIKSGVASGTAIVGTFRGIVLPPVNFEWGLANNLGVALNSSAAAAIEAVFYSENENQ